MEDSSSGGGFISLIIMLVILIVFIVANIKLYKKFGHPAWKAIVPIVNVWVYFEMGGMPGWLIFIPGVNGIVAMIATYQIAKKLGKSTGFAVLSIVFYPLILIMSFDSSMPGDQVLSSPQDANAYQNVANSGQPMQMPQDQMQMPQDSIQMPQQPMVNANPEVVSQPVNEAPANTFMPNETNAQPMPQQQVPNVDAPQFTNVDNNSNLQ